MSLNKQNKQNKQKYLKYKSRYLKLKGGATNLAGMTQLVTTSTRDRDPENFYRITDGVCEKLGQIPSLNKLKDAGGLTTDENRQLLPYIRIRSGQNRLLSEGRGSREDSEHNGFGISSDNLPSNMNIDNLNTDVEIPTHIISIALKNYLFTRYGLLYPSPDEGIKVVKGIKTCEGLMNLPKGLINLLSPEQLITKMGIPDPCRFGNYLRNVLGAVRGFNRHVYFRFSELDYHVGNRRYLAILGVLKDIGQKSHLNFSDLEEIIYALYLLNRPDSDTLVTPPVAELVRVTFHGINTVTDFIRVLPTMADTIDDYFENL